ncbi:pVI [Siadenovirus carbocapituli]|uniref:PVI n=1 Tax=Siadenovirus sp. TaxID=2671519 RepID=A0A9E7U230_9ADEN|nr:pVI [Siadenovirus sp.]
MYSSLAPRLGQTTFTAATIGSTELRGGKINWGSLGSSLSNAFKTTGRFLGNQVSRFAKSQTFQDIKRGLHDSGLVRNVAGLAGDTLNSLVDIGRLKLENDLYNLRRKALNNIPADQLAQILQNYQQSHDTVTVQPEVVSSPAAEPRKRPLIEEIVETEAVEEAPALEAPAISTSTIPHKRPRIRGTGRLEWQQQLNNMLGEGVRYTSTKHCY